MKASLTRYFKIKYTYPGKTFIHYEELVKWFAHYESADVEYTAVNLSGIECNVSYSSATPGALKTAEHILKGDILKPDELKELEFLPLVNRKLKLPLVLWAMFIHDRSLSSNALTTEFAARISDFVDSILSTNQKNILICNHGFVMMFLQKELIRRGFKSDKFKTPANGKIHIFDK
jgi:broad specificity phosphatase PhoE